MPICINLLAEAKAAEELRRKDPVKRAIFISGCIVFFFALWSTSLQVKIIATKSELHGLQSRWREMEKNYTSALEAQKRWKDVETKLGALHQLATNRFLWGTTFNALQQSLNTVDDVHITRLKTDQVYAHIDEVKPRRDGTRTVPGKPASAIERISIILDAIDSSPQPGGRVSAFKESIATVPYFQSGLQKTNGVLLTSLSAPQMSTSGRSQVNFTLQCFFPEKVRQ
jgi:hypothetical protein